MSDCIQIMEKPDWVSWDDIHDVLWKAHERNRENGIIMRYPSLPGDEIRKRIEGKGKMLVAIEGNKIVGTSAIIFKEQNMWCGKGQYAYCCFDSVAPENQGKGIYRLLCVQREKEARLKGVERMLLDTNETNQREIDVVLRNGFKKVAYRFWKDHYNVVFVKWLDRSPFSDKYINRKFKISKVLARIQFKPGKVERSHLLTVLCKILKKVFNVE